MPRVYALKDNVQKFIVHPANHTAFNRDGWAEWPMDQFTQRRIRDGDVSLKPPQKDAPRRVTSRSDTSSS